jgi:uncharacterized protein (TIGR00369 family)
MADPETSAEGALKPEIPMLQCYLDAVLQEDQNVHPLFAFLRARLTLAKNGEAEIVMPVTDCLRQEGGMVAGGILATLADEAMAHAVLSELAEGLTTVTAEMNIRYLRASDPKEGGKIRARAKVVKSGHSLCVAESAVHGPCDRLLATAGATFYVLKAGSPPPFAHVTASS